MDAGATRDGAEDFDDLGKRELALRDVVVHTGTEARYVVDTERRLVEAKVVGRALVVEGHGLAGSSRVARRPGRRSGFQRVGRQG